MEKMMHTMSDKITEFTYVTRQKYGTDSYAAGYLSSMLDEMIREMRIRGTKEMKEMADHYDRLLRTSIKNIQEGK